MTNYLPDDFASQLRDKHLFLSDEMALKYGFGARELEGWTRMQDLCGWRSPYPNPWSVIHAASDHTHSVKASFGAAWIIQAEETRS